MRTLVRRFALLFGLFIGFAASQLPEFAQQYRQRLGGALDELTRLIDDFDGQAAGMGLGRDTAVARLEGNSDMLVRQRGISMRETISRRDRLAAQDAAFDKAGPFGRLVVLARDFDAGIARRAWDRFEPALPVTSEGLICGGLGLVCGYGAWTVAARPLRRRRPERQVA